MNIPAAPYPVQLEVDYPDRELNRLTTAFRVIVAIPILILLATIGGTISFGVRATLTGGGLLVLAPLIMILFRQKYPRWWFDWNAMLLAFENRVLAYVLLLRDEYPSTDDEQNVHLELRYPDVPVELKRWLPLVKWFLAIPHYVALIGLDIASLVIVVIAWFAILFTGRYPRWAFDFIVGVMRWHNRVLGYAFILITDQYPPFRLDS
jgi:hypothetical protein